MDESRPHQLEKSNELIKWLQGEDSQRDFAKRLGIHNHTVISRWRKMGISAEGLCAISRYLDCSLKDVDRFLAGDISVDQLGLSDTGRINHPNPPNRLSINVVLTFLADYATKREKIRAYRWLSDWLVELAAKKQQAEAEWIEASNEPKTIAALIAIELQNRPEAGIEQLAEDTGLSVERLQQLQTGDRPTASEVCDLALGLRKQPDVYWLEEELWEIRIQQFGRNKNGDATEATNGETSVK